MVDKYEDCDLKCKTFVYCIDFSFNSREQQNCVLLFNKQKWEKESK